jgi:hypothetical protein
MTPQQQAALVRRTNLYLSPGNLMSPFLRETLQQLQEELKGSVHLPANLSFRPCESQETEDHMVFTLHGLWSENQQVLIGNHTRPQENRIHLRRVCHIHLRNKGFQHTLSAPSQQDRDVDPEEWEAGAREGSKMGLWFQSRWEVPPFPRTATHTRYCDFEIKLGVPKRGGPSYRGWLHDTGGEGLTEYLPLYGIEKVLFGSAPAGEEGGVRFWEPALSPDPQNLLRLGHVAHAFWGPPSKLDGLWEAVQCGVTGAEPLELARRLGLKEDLEFHDWSPEGVLHQLTLGQVYDSFLKLAHAISVVCRDSESPVGNMRWADSEIFLGGFCHTRTFQSVNDHSFVAKIQYQMLGGWRFSASDPRTRNAGREPYAIPVPAPHPPSLTDLTWKGARDYVHEEIKPRLEEFLRDSDAWYHGGDWDG